MAQGVRLHEAETFRPQQNTGEQKDDDAGNPQMPRDTLCQHTCGESNRNREGGAGAGVFHERRVYRGRQGDPP